MGEVQAPKGRARRDFRALEEVDSARLSHVCAWAGLAALLCLSFLPVVRGERTLLPFHAGVMPEGPYGYEGSEPAPAVFDPAGSALIDLPLVKLAGEYWRHGRVPLWNEYNGCGSPLLGRPDAGACSPMRLPLYLNPSAVMWNVFFLARLWLAGVLTYHLGRVVGLGGLPAFAAANAYMLSGYLVLSLNLHHLDAEVVLPGVLLAIHLAFTRPSLLGFVFGCAVFWQFMLGNNPQATGVGLLMAGGWTAAMWWVVNKRLFHARLPIIALMLLVGLAGSLFHLLPFAEYARSAWHMHAAGGSRSSSAFLPLASLRCLAGPWAGMGTPPFYYAGLSVIVLAATGLLRKPPRAAGGLMILLGLTVALELAKIFGFPGSGVLLSLPGLEHIWFVKYAGPLFLALALLAGAGLAALSACASADRRRTMIAAVGIALVWTELSGLAPRPHPLWHDPLEPAPYVEWLSERQAVDREMRICGVGTVMMPNLSSAFHLRDVRLESSMMSRDQRKILYEGLSAPKDRRLETFITLDALNPERLSLLRKLGVRYLMTSREYPPPSGLKLAYDAEIRIYRIEGAEDFGGFPARGRSAFAIGLLSGAFTLPFLLMEGARLTRKGAFRRQKSL